MFAVLASIPLILAAATSAATCDASAPRRAAAASFDVKAYGAKGDGRTDDTRALQAALDAARVAGGGVVFVPAGTYLVGPPSQPGRRSTLDSITIGSNVTLRGEGPASVLKVKDGVGSYRSLFSNYPTAASRVENVAISDLRIDQNCAGSGGTVATGDEGDHLFVVYLAWGAKNVSVDRVRFDPICGVNTVVMNAADAQGLAVRDSYFRFVKGPSDGYYDNSAVYLHGDGSAVIGNVFESTAADGARGAVELHGRSGVASSNVTRWYHSCVRLAGTNGPDEKPPAQNGFAVVGNECAHAKDAINVWSITGHHVRGVTIAANTISLAELDHLAQDPTLEYFFGISFVWDSASGGLDGDVTDVVVERNTITAQRADGVLGSSAPTSGGISLASQGNIANVTVRGNVIRDVPTAGIHLQARKRGAKASNVRIDGNVVENAGNDPSAGPHRAGILLAGRLEGVDVARNTISSTIVPFRGLYAISASAEPGSRGVSVHDNVWTSADPRAAYRVRVSGPVDVARNGAASRR